MSEEKYIIRYKLRYNSREILKWRYFIRIDNGTCSCSNPTSLNVAKMSLEKARNEIIEIGKARKNNPIADLIQIQILNAKTNKIMSNESEIITSRFELMEID